MGCKCTAKSFDFALTLGVGAIVFFSAFEFFRTGSFSTNTEHGVFGKETRSRAFRVHTVVLDFLAPLTPLFERKRALKNGLTSTREIKSLYRVRPDAKFQVLCPEKRDFNAKEVTTLQPSGDLRERERERGKLAIKK